MCYTEIHDGADRERLERHTAFPVKWWWRLVWVLGGEGVVACAG